MRQENMRAFSIIAHIDHGKSTLADRILEATGAVSKREAKAQLLDSMELERERGITIKLNAVELSYEYLGHSYLLSLIDTPGHVDFSYEVSRSLAACEGALLVVDATQGVEAQTLANLYLALENHLVVLPVINKIDLPSADVDKVTHELENLGFDQEDILQVSAKTGEGIDRLMDAIIHKIPAPKGDPEGSLSALIFDSVYDAYRGVGIAIRIMDGTLKKGDIIYMMDTKASYEVTSLFMHTPKEKEVDTLKAGEVGYLYASIKSIEDVHVGDTITLKKNPVAQPLSGYKRVKSMVYAGIYPMDSSQFEDLREALMKLKLNDASLTFEPETSLALGFGFRCGFLGLLHMEIIEERIRREAGIDIIVTSPSVIYQCTLTNHEEMMIDAPNKMPDKAQILEIREPIVKASIYTPKDYIGDLMKLVQEKRGKFLNMAYIDEERVILEYDLPLAEIVFDFFDKLKSYTKGYASFDYELKGFEKADLVRVDILLNHEPVDALSMILHKDFAYTRGKKIVEKLQKLIPRQLFEIPIQASIGNKVIARCDIKALRKDVLAKCYGGDITRKKKLLEKQKEGKKRMKKIGSVELPQDIFMSVLKMDDTK